MDTHNIQTVCAIGTGTMGASTALAFALYGHNVKMYGRSDTSIQNAMGTITTALEALQKRRLIKKSDIPIIMGRIKPTKNLEEAAAGADIAIESVAEDLEIKQGLFRALDNLCPEHTIFATNTSSLSPTKIAEAVSDERKPKVIALHFFNQAHTMPLVEVIPGQYTSEATQTASCLLMQNIGKTPALLKQESAGFIVNYLQNAFLKAADELVGKGEAVVAVDRAARQALGPRSRIKKMLNNAPVGDDLGLFGYMRTTPSKNKSVKFLQDALWKAADELVDRGNDIKVVEKATLLTLGLRLQAMGMLTIADMGGLDIFAAIRKNVSGDIPDRSSRLEKLVEQENFGAKTGRGFYDWAPEKLAAVQKARATVLFRHLRRELTKQFGTPHFPSFSNRNVDHALQAAA